MAMHGEESYRYTHRLNEDDSLLEGVEGDPLQFRSVPLPPEEAGDRPVWRVRFILASDPRRQFGLAINDEVSLGRAIVGEAPPDLVDLSPYGAGELGVSRRHLMLRPTATNLFVIDLGSTNGSKRNGRSIGVKTPYSLVDGDSLALGRLRFLIDIVERPSLAEAPREQRIDLADALLEIAKSITSQLDLDDVLNQVVETAQALTAAGETGIWLTDEETGQLLLAAERGMEDRGTRRLNLPSSADTHVGEVIRTAEPLRISREPGEDEVKVKTGFLVEAVAYVPIGLGGVTFGVLAATHREPGKKFSERDERLLDAIADFAAIAIQNARAYHVTDVALQRRLRELAALNKLSHTVSASLDLDRVYEVLVEQVNEYWPVDAVRLYLVDEQSRRLLPHHAGTPLPLDGQGGIIRKVAQEGVMIVTNNLPGHPDYHPHIDNTNGNAPRSLACAPLRVQDRVAGVLALYNKAGGPFTEEDSARLRAFTNPIAAALENARLFAESERQRAAIQATARTLSQPLLILDDSGQILIANNSAREILDTHMPQLFEGLSSGVGRTTELVIGEKTYLTTAQHVKRVGTIVVMQDITYEKKLERERSELMHALSHDMKTPLTSIIGYAYVLERTADLDERGLHFVNQVHQAAERMQEMLVYLLRTVDDTSVIQMEMGPCALVPLVENVIKDTEGAALKKSIQLSAEQRGKSSLITADQTRLYHVILNLVDNAIKYSPPETEVTVHLNFKPEQVVIKVEDEGPGIPPEDLPHLFDKHYRGRHTDEEKGSGMGLYLVRGTVQAHDGTISVSNRPEGGAVFEVVLPRLDPAASA